MTDFKIILSSLMDEYGMDQKTLAARTGLTQATISRYTLGKAIPTGENLGLNWCKGCKQKKRRYNYNGGTQGRPDTRNKKHWWFKGFVKRDCKRRIR